MSSKKLLTLVFVQRDNQLLLGLKKRGFGEGRWNGFGGKVQPGETIVDGALRELKEESGVLVDPQDLKKVGEIDFTFVGDPVVLNVHVFHTLKFTGSITESEEMKPQWYDIQDIPYDKMWPDDELWYPIFLNGKSFKANFLFEGHDKILNHSIEEDISFQ